jgi:uncharacterized membrane protein
MSLEALGQLNWLAVIVGAVIYFALGAVWYSVLFSKPWQRAVGMSPDQAQAQMSPAIYAIPLVAYLVMAVAVGMLAHATDSTTLADGVVLGLVVGIGLALAHTAVDATFDPNKPQPWVWFAINGSYHALGLLIVAVIVSVWR